MAAIPTGLFTRKLHVSEFILLQHSQIKDQGTFSEERERKKKGSIYSTNKTQTKLFNCELTPTPFVLCSIP